MLDRPRSGGTTLPLAALLLLASCAGPVRDPSTLEAIRTEALHLAASHPIDPKDGWADVAKSELPPVIASLHPVMVTVSRWGVHIMTKPDFDGGWGYEIPLHGKQDLSMPPGCYSEPGPGVFWHGPC